MWPSSSLLSKFSHTSFLLPPSQFPVWACYLSQPQKSRIKAYCKWPGWHWLEWSRLHDASNPFSPRHPFLNQDWCTLQVEWQWSQALSRNSNCALGSASTDLSTSITMGLLQRVSFPQCVSITIINIPSYRTLSRSFLVKDAKGWSVRGH